ncbi:MAG: response regulator transcription factor [Caldilineaceae bacterium]|nr:response regulator transcription factor [Caldilineaceae bacterium]
MRVFIASSDQMFRLALLLLLESEPGMAVIGVTDRAEGLAALLGISKSEVLLLDYEIDKQELMVGVIDEIHAIDNSPKIVVFSIDPHVETLSTTAGVEVFISKTVPPDALLPKLRELLSARSPE